MPSKKVGQLMAAYEIVSKQKTIPMINGWVGYGLDSRGWVMAGQNQKGLDMVSTFEPVGEWKEVADILQAQMDFKKLLLTLNDKEINEFRTLRGYPTMEEEARGAPIFKKKEFNPNHDPDDGRFTSGDGGGGDNGGAGSKQAKAPKAPAVKVDAKTAVDRWRKFADSSQLQGFSFDPNEDRGYDFGNVQDAKDFNKANGDGTNIVWAVAITNHLGEPSRETEAAYDQIVNTGHKPLLGHWHDVKTNINYNDVSYPLDHGVSIEDVRKLLRENAQEATVGVTPEGDMVEVRAWD